MTQDTALLTYLKPNLVFSQFDSDMFQLVEKYLKFVELAPNDYLFHEGETGNYMAFVLVGGLAILKKDKAGTPIVIHQMKQGDSIGEMGLLDELTRSASVQATQMTALVTLSRQDFEEIVNQYPAVGVAMLRGIAMILSLNLRRTSENLSRNVG